jgi:hypothetical protein
MKAIPLAPRIAVAVDLQDETVIESDVARIHGTSHGVVHVGGSSAQSVRIAGTPDAMRRLADALTEAAAVRRQSA